LDKIYEGLQSEAEREAAYDRFVWENLRRNYAGHYVHGMLGMTGFRLINAPTFMPAYLHVICGVPWLVGLALSLQQLGGMFSAIIGATLIEHRKRVLPASIFLGSMMRVQILGLGLAGFFLSDGWLIAAVMFFLFMLGLFSGPQGVAFQYLLAKVIPIRLRGRLQGWRNVTGGLIAAALSYVAGKYLVGENVFGNGYGTTFLLAFVLTSLGLTAFRFLLREPEPPTIRPKMAMRDRFREMPAMLKNDRGFMYFMIARTFAIAGRVAAPFYIIYAGTAVTLSGEAIGTLSFAYLIADTVTNLAWGYMADRSGFRSTFVVALIIWIAATALLMSVHTMPMFALAFFGLGAAASGYQMSAQNIVFEFGHRDDMAMRLALSNTAENAMTTVGPVAGGLIVLSLGYFPLFMVSMAFEAIALILLLVLVKEPRHRHMDPIEAAGFEET
jgi:MFS family permease